MAVESMIKIRPMVKEDLEDVVELGLSTAEIQQNPLTVEFFNLPALEQRLVDTVFSRVALTADLSGLVVGFSFATCYRYKSADLHIPALVDSMCRGWGIGSLLLQETILRLKEVDCRYVSRLVPTGDSPIKRFLTKNGFEEGGLSRDYNLELMGLALYKAPLAVAS